MIKAACIQTAFIIMGQDGYFLHDNQSIKLLP